MPKRIQLPDYNVELEVDDNVSDDELSSIVDEYVATQKPAPAIQQLSQPFTPSPPAPAPAKFKKPEEISKQIDKSKPQIADTPLGQWGPVKSYVDYIQQKRRDAALEATGQKAPTERPWYSFVTNPIDTMAEGYAKAEAAEALPEYLTPGQSLTTDDQLGRAADVAFGGMDMLGPLGIATGGGSLLLKGGQVLAKEGLKKGAREIALASRNAAKAAATKRGAQVAGGIAGGIAGGAGGGLAGQGVAALLGGGQGAQRFGNAYGSILGGAAAGASFARRLKPPKAEPQPFNAEPKLVRPFSGPVGETGELVWDRTSKAVVMPADELPQRIAFIKEWLADKRPNEIKTSTLESVFNLGRNEARRVVKQLQDEGWLKAPTRRFASSEATPVDEAFNVSNTLPGVVDESAVMARARVGQDLGPTADAVVPDRWFSDRQLSAAQQADQLGGSTANQIVPQAWRETLRVEQQAKPRSRVETVVEYTNPRIESSPNSNPVGMTALPLSEALKDYRNVRTALRRMGATFDATGQAISPPNVSLPPALVAYHNSLSSYRRQYAQARMQQRAARAAGAPPPPLPAVPATPRRPMNVDNFDEENLGAVPVVGLRDRLRNAYQATVNPMHPVDALERKATATGALPESPLGNGEIAADASASFAAAQARRTGPKFNQDLADSDMQNLIRDLRPTQAKAGIGFWERVKDNFSKKPRIVQKFNQYLHERDQLERMALDPEYVPAAWQEGTSTAGKVRQHLGGKDTGTAPLENLPLDQARLLATQRAQAVMQQYDSAFKPIADRVYAFRDETRKRLLDAGGLDQATYDLWMRDYQNYTPERRQQTFNPFSVTDVRSGGRGSSGAHPRPPVMGREGTSSLPTDNQLEAILDARARAIRFEALNTALRTHVEHIRQGVPGFQGRVMTSTQAETIPLKNGNRRAEFYENGQKMVVEMPKQQVNAFDSMKSWADTYASRILPGANSDSLRALFSTVAVGTQPAVQAGLVAVNILSATLNARRPGGMLKRLPQATLEWAISRIDPAHAPVINTLAAKAGKLRDSGVAKAVLGEPPVGRVIRNANGDVVGYDALAVYRESRRQGVGGAAGQFHEGAPELMVESILYPSWDPTFYIRRLTNPKNTYEWLTQKASHFISYDEAIRMAAMRGAYEASRKAGATHKSALAEAARNGIEATGDFTLGGPIVQAMNAWLAPFTNAVVQGTRLGAKTLAGHRGIEGQMQAGMGMANAAMAGYASTLWNLSDPKRRQAYLQLDEQTKDRGIVFLGDEAPGRFGPNRVAAHNFKLEGPYKIAANTARRLAEAVVGETQDEEFAKKWLQQLVSDTVGYYPGDYPWSIAYTSEMLTGRDMESGFGYDRVKDNRNASWLAQKVGASAGQPAGQWQTRIDRTPLLALIQPGSKAGDPNRARAASPLDLKAINDNITGRVSSTFTSIPALAPGQRRRKMQEIRKQRGNPFLQGEN